MQQLEREIGEQLLVRVPHGVELTDSGRELLGRARVAVDAADDALAMGREEHPHGRLLLGLPLAGGRQRWFELTQAFVERFPAVEVEVREALSEQLQRQVLEGELDGALAVAPNRLPGLTYTHVLDEPVSVWMHEGHPLAGRPELSLADLGGETITLLGGPAARSGFNAAIKALFAESGVQPDYGETPQLYPPRAGLVEGYVGVTVPLDYPDGVVSIPLVPARTLPFEFVQRAETNRSAVRAFARFAAEHLSG
jgi:DNA-binding transcriptional LysR family regulator